MSDLEPITREETFLNAIAENQSADLTPTTRQEIFLNAIATGQSAGLTPVTREEHFYQKIIDNGSGGGGGGSSTLSTCKLTVGSAFQDRHELFLTLPVIDENGYATPQGYFIGGEYDIILSNGKARCVYYGDDLEGTGDFMYDADEGTFEITGDCEITGYKIEIA